MIEGLKARPVFIRRGCENIPIPYADILTGIKMARAIGGDTNGGVVHTARLFRDFSLICKKHSDHDRQNSYQTTNPHQGRRE